MFYRIKENKYLIASSLIVFICIIFFLMSFLHSFSNNLKQSKKDGSTDLISVGVGVIGYFYDLESKGELSKDDAQKYAMGALEKAVYGKAGYFWIHRADGQMLMLPYFPELVGTNLSNRVDSRGVHYNSKMTEVAKAGGGVVDYFWKNPTTNNVVLKSSTVRHFKPWDWVLGTGVFYDDLDDAISKIMIGSAGIFIVFVIFIISLIVAGNLHTYKVRNFANLDSLTDLHSKRFINEILPDLERRHQTDIDALTVVMFIDVDNFKYINEKLGHDGGDEVLKTVSDIIKRTTRGEDYSIRFGGDEFVVISIYTDERAILKTAERIKNNVAELRYGPSNINITISIGVAIYNEDDDSLVDTISRADKKLYESKEQGKNRVTI